MNEQLMERARLLAQLPFGFSVSRDETTDGNPIVLVENAELPGCMAQGDSFEEALLNLADARVDYIYSMLEDGLEVPLPEQVNTVTSGETDNFDDELTMKGHGTTSIDSRRKDPDGDNGPTVGRFAVNA